MLPFGSEHLREGPEIPKSPRGCVTDDWEINRQHLFGRRVRRRACSNGRACTACQNGSQSFCSQPVRELNALGHDLYRPEEQLCSFFSRLLESTKALSLRLGARVARSLVQSGEPEIGEVIV